MFVSRVHDGLNLIEPGRLEPQTSRSHVVRLLGPTDLAAVGGGHDADAALAGAHVPHVPQHRHLGRLGGHANFQRDLREPTRCSEETTGLSPNQI